MSSAPAPANGAQTPPKSPSAKSPARSPTRPARDADTEETPLLAAAHDEGRDEHEQAALLDPPQDESKRTKSWWFWRILWTVLGALVLAVFIKGWIDAKDVDVSTDVSIPDDQALLTTLAVRSQGRSEAGLRWRIERCRGYGAPGYIADGMCACRLEHHHFVRWRPPSANVLKWIRTIMNYQYRHGSSLTTATKTLYAEGGIPRFYQGAGWALIQGPVSRFGDTAANAGILALLQSNGYLSQLPSLIQTIFASVW